MKILTALAILFAVLLIADLASGHSTVETAEVVDRNYEPSRQEIEYIYIDGNPYPQVRHVSEKWSVIVRMNGRVVPVQTDAHRWAGAQQGDAVSVASYIGGLTGFPYGLELR